MSNFKILIFEDEEKWKDAFVFNVQPKIELNGKTCHILHRLDDSTLMQDLEWLPNVIMVDYDLVHLTGEQIIEAIANDPDYVSVSIFFYSGGESIDTLKAIASKFECNIRCFTKEGDELENAIINLV
jgi:hypothetical protein